MDFKRILKDKRLPALLLDLEAFDRNVAVVAKWGQRSGKKIRIASKSIRSSDLIERVLKSDPVYQGVLCYAVEEAEHLSKRGIDDLLIAYPTVQKSDLDIFIRLSEQGKKIRLVVDSVEQIHRLYEFSKNISKPLEVVIDFDMSLRLLGGRVHLGVRRSPVRTLDDLRSLLRAAKKYPTLRIVGVMAYEAQVAGLGDRNPFKKALNPLAAWVRARSVDFMKDIRSKIPKVFSDEGIELEIFNGGGTGSLNYCASESGLTELTAGSAFFSSGLFDYYSNIRFEPSLFFALQASRSSDPGIVTCLGGGYIASGEPGWDRLPTLVYPPGAKPLSTEGFGEVQTPVKLTPSQTSGSTVELGDPVIFRHAKAGEVCERFEKGYFVSNGRISGEFLTYRGEGACFF